MYDIVEFFLIILRFYLFFWFFGCFIVRILIGFLLLFFLFLYVKFRRLFGVFVVFVVRIFLGGELEFFVFCILEFCEEVLDFIEFMVMEGLLEWGCLVFILIMFFINICCLWVINLVLYKFFLIIRIDILKILEDL